MRYFIRAGSLYDRVKDGAGNAVSETGGGRPLSLSVGPAFVLRFFAHVGCFLFALFVLRAGTACDGDGERHALLVKLLSPRGTPQRLALSSALPSPSASQRAKKEKEREISQESHPASVI